MGSIAHHYPVPGRLHGECSEGTSCLGLTTSVYRQTLQERYSMVRFIAQGGFGKVFLARHCATGMQVAMKKLTKTGARAASILSEVGLLKDLQHPNITQLLEVIETEHRIYLVLEYVDGVNLRKEICRSKKNRLREKEAQRIFADILGAVDYCHKRGIVHGDLKPDNVLIDTKGRAKICDFGLGIRCLPGQEVTAVGGTLAYYAPERLSRRRYEGPPLDVWALGLTLYEMITGDRPFYGSESEMIGSILYGIIFYPRFISSNVKHLIIKMLSRDPTMRPTLQEVLKHRWLRNVRPPCPLEPPPVSIKRAVLSRMAKMGFNVLTVVDTLRRKEYNDIMATFLLLQSQALQGPVHEAAEEISWPLTGPAPSAPIPWRRASEPAPCTGRLFAGVKPRGGEQGGRGSQPPMTIQRTPTRSVSPQPGPASPLLSPQPGPAEPSLSPQPGPASPRLSPQPGPASPRLSPQPGPASPRLSPQPGPASPRLSPQPGPASPRLSPQPGPASPRLSPQPGPASPRLSPQPGPAEPSLSPQPGPAEPSLSPQPGPASPRLSPQPGPASPRLSPQPGPASPRLSPQPGPTSPSLSPQPGPASPRLSPQPGPASPRLSPQPGPASPRLSSQPGPASPRLSPQPGSASPCLSPQPGPASPRLSPQPDPPASSLSCQSGLGAPRSSSRSTSAPANSGRRSWKALKRSLTASLRALCCCCLPPSGHHRHKVAPTFRKVHEQMEAEIAHLKQENSILRDAVSSATNQLDRKQSAELNKLRQDYARLVHELTEKTGQLQQEEVQKKSAEQAATQVKVQLQEAERRWEEVQAYIRKRTAEHEAAQQDLQGKFVSKENEVQSLHSKLTDTLVSKQQLEQRLMQLMESEQKRVKKEESLQMQVQDILEQNEALKAQIQQFHSQRAAQTSTSVLAEELHKVIAEKDKQTKPTEDSLASEHDHLTRKEEELKERQYVEAVELEAKEVPKKLFPKVSVHSHLKAKECIAGISGSEEVKVLEFKLKEADETRTLLQLECDTYKSVLAETEGILQKLQKSVEEEENKWKVKVDELQKTIKQLRREREHLEMELEKAEIERSTYVTEVRELKDLLTELQKKLDDSYSEAVRQNEELNLESSEKETMSVSLNQTIAQLQQLLQAVNKQLTKEK